MHREHCRDATETDQQGDGQGPRSSLQPGGHCGSDYQSLQGETTRLYRPWQIRVVHLDVEVRSEELLAPALLCNKEPARASKAPY